MTLKLSKIHVNECNSSPIFFSSDFKIRYRKNCAKQVQFICPGKKHHISISLFLHAVCIIFIYIACKVVSLKLIKSWVK